jgi:hypothetical protein
MLSETTWDQVMRKYAAGVRLRELAATYGISKKAISIHAKKHGVLRNPTPNPCALAKEVEMIDREAERAARPIVAIAYDTSATEILRLHSKGRSHSEIGALLRIPYRQIDAALQLAGRR